jgi:hypothetical protein
MSLFITIQTKKTAEKVAEIPAGRTYHTLVRTYEVNNKKVYSVYWSEK